MSWRISSWGVVLQGAGNLVPHIYLDGYLGGVYYPQIPDIVGDEANLETKSGWFELGRPPSELPLEAKPKVKPILPEEGLMILFPGYYYHATVPFESTQQRVSVAFDVVAED
ncbi:MAG: putative 2OG-Fe(II) oxygenase [Alphaproteobacteria bacterium]